MVPKRFELVSNQMVSSCNSPLKLDVFCYFWVQTQTKTVASLRVQNGPNASISNKMFSVAVVPHVSLTEKEDLYSLTE